MESDRFVNLASDQERLRKVLTSRAGLSDDDHGRDTAERVLNMYQEMTSCSTDMTDEDHLKTCIKWKAFPSHTDEMIVIDNIPFVSLCNHHMVPFQGVVHIAYVPRDREAGLSKFARVVGHFARRLQVQERMTAQIADYLEKALENPRGVAVMVRAEHLCMTIRGVKAPGANTTTSAMRGVYGDHTRTAKAEFLSIVNSNGRKH